MAIRDIFKINRKTFFNPREWLGYDLLKVYTQTFIAIVRNVFNLTTPKLQRQETFEQAMARFKLTADGLKNLEKTYLRLAYFFAGLGGFIFLLGIYFLIHFYLAGFLLSLGIGVFLFGQAFRFHFWHFQIVNRKLGCTYEEWRQGKINGEKTS